MERWGERVEVVWEDSAPVRDYALADLGSICGLEPTKGPRFTDKATRQGWRSCLAVLGASWRALIRWPLFYATPPCVSRETRTSHAFTRRRNDLLLLAIWQCKICSSLCQGIQKSYAESRRNVKCCPRCFCPLEFSQASLAASRRDQRQYRQCGTPHAHCSRKVNRFVCRMLIALSASRSSITQDMLISLAPITLLVSLDLSVSVSYLAYLARSFRYSHCSLPK